MRRDETTKGTVQNLVTSVPGRCLLDRSKNCSGERISILANQIQCFILHDSVPADCLQGGKYQN